MDILYKRADEFDGKKDVVRAALLEILKISWVVGNGDRDEFIKASNELYDSLLGEESPIRNVHTIV